MNRKCCFIGHRSIKDIECIKNNLYMIVEDLILNSEINEFFFGSRGQFNKLCYDVVSSLKDKYPYIKRVYVRGEYENINDKYRQYLLTYYEDTYFPKWISGAGKLSYVERNREMINFCDKCVFYYDETYAQNMKTSCFQNSGTELAYKYAIKKHKKIINTFKC